MIKDKLKKHLFPHMMKKRLSAEVQLGQRQLYLTYRNMLASGTLPSIDQTRFRVFSQYGEDGMLWYIFSVLGLTHGRFLDVGSADGIRSNCANLALNHGWLGLFIDGKESNIERGRRFYGRLPNPYWSWPPTFSQNLVTAENINQVVKDGGLEGDIELMSIDIDGNDYWIWKALEVVSPKVVIIETHVEYGMNNVVTPYDPNYFYPGKHPHYHGASPVAMAGLGTEKGYRLVGSNVLGFNFIFLRNDLVPDLIPAVSVEDQLKHPSTVASFAKFDEIKDWEYVRPGES